MKTLVIGTDEAGYGPKLGPLVVTATAWLVEDAFFSESANAADWTQADWTQADWFGQLADHLTNVTPKKDDDRLWIGDSKEIYKGKNLAALERVVLGGLASISADQLPPERWSLLLETLVTEQTSAVARAEETALPWYADAELDLPLAISAEEQSAATERWQNLKSDSPAALVGVRSSILEPPQFNAGVERCGNKATLLSETTLSLVRTLIEEVAPKSTEEISRILITCDRHGGRKSYAGVLQYAFDGVLPEIVKEQPECSRYRLPLSPARAEVAFTIKGESQLPIAVASLVSKYVREVAMHLFNAYWQEYLPELVPTAGYTVDADRFCADIANLDARRELDDGLLIRCR